MRSEESGPSEEARYVARRLLQYYRAGAEDGVARLALQALDQEVIRWLKQRGRHLGQGEYLSRDELARCLETLTDSSVAKDAISVLLSARSSATGSRRGLSDAIPGLELKNIFGSYVHDVRMGEGDFQIGDRDQRVTRVEAGEQRRQDRQPARPPTFPWDYGEGDVRVSVAVEGAPQGLRLRYSLEQQIQEGLPGQVDFYQPLSGPIGGYFDERLRGAWKRSGKRGDAFLEGLRRVLDGQLVPPALRRRLEDLTVGGCLVEWVTELAAVPWELLSLPTDDGAPRSLCEVADCARILPGWHRLPDAGGRTVGVVIAEPRDPGDEE